MLDMTLHEIEQMLGDARIGRLCMADRDGRPYVIPLPFCWIENALYLRLPLTGRKGAILTVVLPRLTRILQVGRGLLCPISGAKWQ